MKRYNQLLQLIGLFQPRTICEIGVWNGHNAIRMIQQACKYRQDVEYTGYDLFEDATPETDEKEFNVKIHCKKDEIEAAIKFESRPGTLINLIKGDTNETLQPKHYDLVFVDGGHSIATIAADYAKLMCNPIIVLDDYYTDGPDTEKYGCNDLLCHFTNPNFIVLPAKDPVKGGGFTQFVLVVGGNG